MSCFDVFNGDADGICALIQLRRATPRDATLITGVKRNIALLERVEARKDDEITVLDIAMRMNRQALDRHLTAGARVFYVDHHNAGEIPHHANLTAAIDTRADICTGLLVNTYLKGAYAEWAVMAAFGDNLAKSAKAVAKHLHLRADDLARIREFGELVNYNSYGREISDLHFTPDHLYRSLSGFDSPLECLRNAPEIFDTLKSGYREDLNKARNTKAASTSPGGDLYILDDAPWARRISGSFGNLLAREEPQKAHAVLTYQQNDTYLISIRAPQIKPQGADSLSLRFETGGGRAGAAGINSLPKDQLKDFTSAFSQHWK